MARVSVYERMALSELVATVHFQVPHGPIHAHLADFYHENGMVCRLDGNQNWSVVREPAKHGQRAEVQRDGAEITGVYVNRKVPAGHLPSRIPYPIESAHMAIWDRV